MTTLDLDNNQAKYQIRSYAPGMIQINDKKYTHSLIVSADQLIETWSPQSVAEITAESLEPIVALKPNVLLIGTGGSHVFLSIEIYGELMNQGIGVEIMDTSAACRTFNALTAENRDVVAALII